MIPQVLRAQGTAFTYQGRLQSGANPANGFYDMTFALYNASSGGAQVGSTLTDPAIGVTNGLFTIILDFGGVFNGSSYWLQIGVRSNGVGSYNPLSPRQELTPTPYAITAENVDGLVSASQVTGTLSSSLFPIPLDLSGSTNVPLLEADQAGSGAAIFGNRTTTSGTTPGLYGATASTDNSANAVYGVVSSTSPGADSAGVRGQNNGTGGLGIGVYGSQAGGGWGVYGTAASGVGVEADGGTGYGVYAEGGIGVAAYGFSGDGLDASAETASGIGVLGSHVATTGTAAGVEGTTASTDSSANAVYGQVSSTSPGGFSAGVRGENDGTGGDGIGVYGSQNGSGWGVYGTTPSGYGVYGDSSSGIGVVGGSGSGTGVSASSSSGTGVYASSSSGSALTIGGGTFHVSGAGIETSTVAFIHKATSANTAGDNTTIDNPQCNGDPNAILIVTQNWNPGGGLGVYNKASVGVYYTGSNWAIFNEDSSSMVVGSAYNVLVIKN